MTKEQAQEMMGTCCKCHEHTTVADPCCNAGVYFEGSVWTIDDITEEDDEETKLNFNLITVE